jgi:L,D-peptidoglycan transpeptidase YkuD (ErfK/YbiS/YcfS/YnhG family)
MKREGDGKSPIGSFRLLKGFWRADRLAKPVTTLQLKPLKPTMGWCDQTGHRLYNRPVTLPFGASHEVLTRADTAYDIVIILNHNITPRRQNQGSAIFLHLIRDGASHTEGCVAISLSDMRKILQGLNSRSRLQIGLPDHQGKNQRRSAAM